MIEIVIWISPTDISDLSRSLNRLNVGKDYLTEEQHNNIKFNIVMGISDEIIDWKNSEIDKQECIDEFLKLKSTTNWAFESNFTPSITINGCTSMRRIASYSNSNYYLWLDTDIIFDPMTLPYMLNSVSFVELSNFFKFVIVPEIVRQWDSTWDCLVNDKFINKPIGYQAINNPHIDTIIDTKLDPILVEVHNNIPNQPYMKFGGGWFALISSKLLETIPFPQNYGHYGLDDTYLMWGAQLLQDPYIKQFKLKNIVVCENYFDREIDYKNKIKFLDKREEYKKYNEGLFNGGLESLTKIKQI
jgi:hypothetical protein